MSPVQLIHGNGCMNKLNSCIALAPPQHS